VYRVLDVANRSNQRGGRMLSVVDLLKAGTLDMDQAAWLSARVLGGSSWLVGARPGGAGKTTVMSALLALVRQDSRLWLTNRGSGWAACGPGDYLVSFELSPGSYDAYIWGAEVRRMTELGTAGCRIVSNLHADTLEQARRQIVDECGASERGFRAFQIFIPLSLKGFPPARVPRVEHIDYVEAGEWRRLVRDEQGLFRAGSSEFPEREGKIAEFFHLCLTDGVFLIEEVRKRWMRWIDRFPVLLP
jgi:hypothetical protein